jgi:hypothetical protein
MTIQIIRTPVKGKPTMGVMLIDNKFFSYILEDEDRGLRQDMPLEQINKLKVYGDTAIPSGHYKVSLTWSDKFKRVLPLIKNVPGYSGVRIHRGNFKKDTLGCPLVGYEKGDFIVLDSKNAEIDFVKLFKDSPEKEHDLFIKYQS